MNNKYYCKTCVFWDNHLDGTGVCLNQTWINEPITGLTMMSENGEQAKVIVTGSQFGCVHHESRKIGIKIKNNE